MTAVTDPRDEALADAPANVLFVVRDVEAMRRLGGALSYLATRKHRVHVAVAGDPPGGASLGLFDQRYSGLSVARLPQGRTRRGPGHRDDAGRSQARSPRCWNGIGRASSS